MHDLKKRFSIIDLTWDDSLIAEKRNFNLKRITMLCVLAACSVGGVIVILNSLRLLPELDANQISDLLVYRGASDTTDFENTNQLIVDVPNGIKNDKTLSEVKNPGKVWTFLC